MLNRWGRAAPSRCKTFENGAVISQIDYICTGRRHADEEARKATPIALDLAPWRKGPKHFPIKASIPWVQGWKLVLLKPRLSKKDMLQGISLKTPPAQELKTILCSALQQLSVNGTVQELNRSVLPACQRLFPLTRRSVRREPGQVEVANCIQGMWHAHSRLAAPGPYLSFRRASKALRRLSEFQAAFKALRTASRQKRKAWFEEQVDAAEQAAAKHDLRTVYAVVSKLAPRRRAEKVRIRSSQGHLLTVKQEFQEIYAYFSDAFGRNDDFSMPAFETPLCFTEEEILGAIQDLRTGKAVPDGSLPADVWLLAPTEMASFCTGVLNRSAKNQHQFPSEATRCQLSLLPKPGKPSRRPRDLRPLGLQNPLSKFLANALKARVLAEVGSFLNGRPQYAYCPGKAIDGAINRVVRHCSRVRMRLQQGSLSVHARREGRSESLSYGGLMISLDMSRAFDEIPRSVLAKALTHAGVSAALQHAILSLHEQCLYEVHHEEYSGTFDMLKGVRQGCALVPLLFAIFSCWLYDEIVCSTAPGWAETLLTLFADDSHLALEVEGPDDLAKMRKAVRAVFKVFREAGMQVNPTKSRLVLGLRGSAARRWPQRHACTVDGQPAISLGTPTEPLVIPKVSSMVYLGIVVSYQRFEVQTFEHRLRAAMHNRQRLLRILHRRRVATRTRVRLYEACVRSALVYGLHATGLPIEVLRRLDSFDAKALRGIVKSPAHLTHESTYCLRQRLGSKSPLEYLTALLRRRAQYSGDADSRSWFQQQLCMLEPLVGVWRHSGVACRQL